jgi:hypothetical protein
LLLLLTPLLLLTLLLSLTLLLAVLLSLLLTLLPTLLLTLLLLLPPPPSPLPLPLLLLLTLLLLLLAAPFGDEAILTTRRIVTRLFPLPLCLNDNDTTRPGWTVMDGAGRCRHKGTTQVRTVPLCWHSRVCVRACAVWLCVCGACG